MLTADWNNWTPQQKQSWMQWQQQGTSNYPPQQLHHHHHQPQPQQQWSNWQQNQHQPTAQPAVQSHDNQQEWQDWSQYAQAYGNVATDETSK